MGAEKQDGFNSGTLNEGRGDVWFPNPYTLHPIKHPRLFAALRTGIGLGTSSILDLQSLIHTAEPPDLTPRT